MKLVFVVSLMFCYVAAEDFHEKYNHTQAVHRMLRKLKQVTETHSDVMAVIDGSKDATKQGFEKQVQAAKRLFVGLNKLHEIGDDKTRVGAVQYSTPGDTAVEMELGEFNTVDKLMTKLDNIKNKYQNGNARAIGSGLMKAKEHLKEKSRKTKRKVVWLTVTGKNANDVGANLETQVKKLINYGVQMCIWLMGKPEDLEGQRMNSLAGCTGCFDKFPSVEAYRNAVIDVTVKLIEEAKSPA